MCDMIAFLAGCAVGAIVSFFAIALFFAAEDDEKRK